MTKTPIHYTNEQIQANKAKLAAEIAEATKNEMTAEQVIDYIRENGIAHALMHYSVIGYRFLNGKFYNPLEDKLVEMTDADYEDNGLLVGTVNEPWKAPLKKILKDYTLADGSPVTLEDLTADGVEIWRKPGFNIAVQAPHAMYITTANGERLLVKTGAYLVCGSDFFSEEGTGIIVPDWGVWTIDEGVFVTTNTPVDGYVIK